MRHFPAHFLKLLLSWYVNLTKASQERKLQLIPSGTQMQRLLTEQLTRAGVSEHPPPGPCSLEQSGPVGCSAPSTPCRTHTRAETHTELTLLSQHWPDSRGSTTAEAQTCQYSHSSSAQSPDLPPTLPGVLLATTAV